MDIYIPPSHICSDTETGNKVEVLLPMPCIERSVLNGLSVPKVSNAALATRARAHHIKSSTALLSLLLACSPILEL